MITIGRRRPPAPPVTRRVILALAVAACVGCGRKASPTAPELVHPKAPGDLVATSTPEGVKLQWSRPTTYTSGKRMRDLDRFEIERSEDTGNALVFTVVHTMMIEDRLRFQQKKRLDWTDTTAVDGRRYLYRVTGLTLDDYRSEPAGPIGIDFKRPPAAKNPASPER